MEHYLAIIEKGDENYGVSFPDFPGCVTVGGTLKDALDNAADALTDYIELLMEDGTELPAPTEDPEIDPDIDFVTLAAVPAYATAPVKRVNITMSEVLLREVDEKAASLGMSRSGFLAHSVRSTRIPNAPAKGTRVVQRAAATGKFVNKSGKRESGAGRSKRKPARSA